MSLYKICFHTPLVFDVAKNTIRLIKFLKNCIETHSTIEELKIMFQEYSQSCLILCYKLGVHKPGDCLTGDTSWLKQARKNEEKLITRCYQGEFQMYAQDSDGGVMHAQKSKHDTNIRQRPHDAPIVAFQVVQIPVPTGCRLPQALTRFDGSRIDETHRVFTRHYLLIESVTIEAALTKNTTPK